MGLHELFIERERKIAAVNNLVDDTNAAGIITGAEIKNIATQRKEISEMDNQIRYAMEQPVDKPILNQPGHNPFNCDSYSRMGISGGDYRKNFVNQIRAGFRNAYNYLQEASPQLGGYLVPCEFHDEIIRKLQDENILRQIGRVITTSSEHKIVVQTQRPTAGWFAEGAAIDFSTPEFAQKSIGAHKLVAAVKVSNELLADSFYDVEGFLSSEFAKVLAAYEENAFLNGDGNGKPAGVIPALASDTSTTITTATSAIAADDVINLVHSLERPYRKNAAFIMSDSTLAAVRKLKDGTQNYLWEANIAMDAPEKLFGYPVYTSAYVPSVASGNIAILFGDFAGSYIIGDRGQMSFQPLRELFAGNDMTGFMLIERVDAVIADTNGIRGLKIR